MPGNARLLIMIALIAFLVWFSRRARRRAMRRMEEQTPGFLELHSSKLWAEARQQHHATLLRIAKFWWLLILLVCLAVGFNKSVWEFLNFMGRLRWLWLGIYACLVLLMPVGIVRYAVDRARCGTVILDLHVSDRIRSRRKAMLFSTLILVGFVYDQIENGSHIAAALLAVYGVAWMYLMIVMNRAPQLTERGIFAGGRLVPWEMVQTYEWTPKGNYLTYRLRLKTRLPMFHYGELHVEEELRDPVSELFEQRVKNATEAA